MHETRDGDADYRIDRSGAQVEIDGECDAGWWRRCNVEFVVTVPDDVDARVRTHNGAIVVDRVVGDIEVRTDNGAITGDDLESSRVWADTNNGRIRLRFDGTPDSVDVTTDNGAIDIVVPDDDTEYAVETDTGNGAVDVDVDVAHDADRVITAESGNGSIDIDYRS